MRGHRLNRCLHRRLTNTTSSKLDNKSNKILSDCSRFASAMRLARDGRPPTCALFSRWLSTPGPSHIETIQRTIDVPVSKSAESRIQSGSQSCVPLRPSSFSPNGQRLANRPPEARFRHNLSTESNKRSHDNVSTSKISEHPYQKHRRWQPHQCRPLPEPKELTRLDPSHSVNRTRIHTNLAFAMETSSCIGMPLRFWSTSATAEAAAPRARS